jgi:RNA polymerase sigma-70 factor (ECF subfamily)
MMSESDAELVEAARRGDRFAFARLVQAHQRGVRGFLRRACGNADNADDLAQETFLSAWEHLGQFRGDASLRSWLCGIGYKKMLASRRSAGRARARDHAYYEDAPKATPAGDPVMNVALEKAMVALAPDQRACVALCLGGGYSHAEAAEALEMPLGTVKSHVNRGRERLLAALGEKP